MNQIRTASTVALVGVVLVVVGCFSPWAVADGYTRTGVSSNGYLLLYPAAAAALVAVATLTTAAVSRFTRWFVLPFALLVLGLTAMHLQQSLGARLFDAAGASSAMAVSWGIWLVVAGAVALLGGSIMMVLARTPRTAS
ncbi:hypothetical protein [Aeromicrobium sp. Leaf350]|uniref:hypothetical protein n=1 Tax=Aeromicrobium sp. Leaf350 TaxID=2876565 RepID=UPI001E367F38|nr:hypothetical protein [Aeromicrobium sp. Leaf350]